MWSFKGLITIFLGFNSSPFELQKHYNYKLKAILLKDNINRLKTYYPKYIL